MNLCRSRHKTTEWIVVSTVLLTLLLFIGCEKKQEEHRAPPPPPPEVAVLTITPQDVELSTELPGRTSAYGITEIRPRVNGIIVKRLFQEGSDVEAGQLLYEIDAAPFRVAYDSARASLGKSRANLTAVRLKAGRLKSLYVEKAISRQDYDDATAALEQAKADVEYWKTSVEAALINLNYTRVTAPISGRIGRSNVTDGALVTAYQMGALATIQQLDPIYIDVTQSSCELLKLKRNLESGQITTGDDGRKVRLILEDGTTYPIEGTLQFAEVTVDPTTGSYSLRIVVPNPNHLLLPGMFVRAVVKEGTSQNSILVPQQGVSRNPKGEAIALIADENDTVVQRELKLERAIGDHWLVSSGLSAGDRLIVEGMIKVRPGSKVKVVTWNPPKPAGEVVAQKQPASENR